MKPDDLKGMTIDQLVALGNQVASILAEKVAAKKAQLEEELAKLAVIEGRKASGNGTKAEPTHRDPATGQTWAGRGQPPKWLTEYEKQGRKREEFLLKALNPA